MVFKCQEDSFLKEFKTTVISSEKATNGSKEGYNVILNDTILFPEGGGQPCDYGTINGKLVRSIVRKADKAVHFVESDEPLEVGQEVKEVLDWPRRMDHMQQHSGQHLITALFDREYSFDTTSWWLGSETSYIELNAKDVTKQQLEHIENLANQLIFEAKKVTVVVTTKEEGIQFQDMRAPRGLPADHIGPVRVVNIEDIESNMCCGTHVSNLSQLQAVKLLHVEKAKSKLYVHFLVGNRVLKKLEDCYSREMQFNNILKGGPSTHVELVQKLQTSSKTTLKYFRNILKELAIAEASKLKAKESLPKYFSLHRNEGIEPDFITTFLRHAPDNVFYFLSVSDSTGKGHVVLKGPENDVSLLGTEFMEILDGKGNGKGTMFQGKVNKISGLKKCEQRLKDYFE